MRELAEQLDCRLLQPASRPWPESLAFLTPLQDAVGAVAAASCQQGHGVRLILTALWAFSLAMFLLSLAGLVLRCWPRELKAWVDRFAAMIVDAFASGLGEPGRARAHAAATAATWLLALGAPAFALGQLPWRDAPPPPPVVTAKEAEQPSDTMAEQERILRDHRATVERLIAGATLTPPINVHVANPPSANPGGTDVGAAVRAAQVAFEDSLRTQLSPIVEAAKAVTMRTDALELRVRSVEVDDQRLDAVRDGLARLTEVDRQRLHHESKPLLQRLRDNLCGRESACVQRRVEGGGKEPFAPPPATQQPKRTEAGEQSGTSSTEPHGHGLHDGRWP